MSEAFTKILASVVWDGGMINDHKVKPNEAPVLEYPKGILTLVTAYDDNIEAKGPVVLFFMIGNNQWYSVNRVSLDEHGNPHLTRQSLGTVRGIDINTILDVEEFVNNQMPFADFVQAVAYDATNVNNPM